MQSSSVKIKIAGVIAAAFSASILHGCGGGGKREDPNDKIHQKDSPDELISVLYDGETKSKKVAVKRLLHRFKVTFDFDGLNHKDPNGLRHWWNDGNENDLNGEQMVQKWENTYQSYEWDKDSEGQRMSRKATINMSAKDQDGYENFQSKRVAHFVKVPNNRWYTYLNPKRWFKWAGAHPDYNHPHKKSWRDDILSQTSHWFKEEDHWIFGKGSNGVSYFIDWSGPNDSSNPYMRFFIEDDSGELGAGEHWCSWYTYDAKKQARKDSFRHGEKVIVMYTGGTKPKYATVIGQSSKKQSSNKVEPDGDE